MSTTLYFVTSLPRSGTTSLCEMANICGLKSLHVLKHISFKQSLNDGYTFFADTPFYLPEFLIGLLESGIQEKYLIKFIYSHRKKEDHLKSIDKFYLTWQKPKVCKLKIDLMDILAHKNVESAIDYLHDHYLNINRICSLYNVPLCDFNFQNGWHQFCEYINKPIPNVNIPHRNKM